MDIAVIWNGNKTNNRVRLVPYFWRNPPTKINVKINADPIETVYFLLEELFAVVELDWSMSIFSFLSKYFENPLMAK